MIARLSSASYRILASMITIGGQSGQAGMSRSLRRLNQSGMIGQRLLISIHGPWLA